MQCADDAEIVRSRDAQCNTKEIPETIVAALGRRYFSVCSCIGRKMVCKWVPANLMLEGNPAMD